MLLYLCARATKEKRKHAFKINRFERIFTNRKFYIYNVHIQIQYVTKNHFLSKNKNQNKTKTLHIHCYLLPKYTQSMQKPELVQQPEVLPKLKKVVKPKEEPKKEEVKRTKVKIPKAKKYEDLPEIPDYERPELEVYEESAFDPTKLEKVDTPIKQAEKPLESHIDAAQAPIKNGLPKVSYFVIKSCCCSS